MKGSDRILGRAARRTPLPMPRAPLVALFLALAATAAAPLAPAFGEIAPRPLSPAERSAVELALALHAEGAAAWWDALDAEAPLRSLDRAEALAEIEVRTGPLAGATWRLRTPGTLHGPETAILEVELASGLQDTLTLELVERGGVLKLATLRSLVDPQPEREALPLAAGPGAGERVAPGSGGREPGAAPLGLLAVLCLGALALGLARVARFAREGPLVARAGLVPAALALVLVLAPWLEACRRPATDGGAAESGAEGPTARAGPPLERLADLLPLRRALAAGDAAAVEPLAAAVPAEPHLGEVARLWLAQDRLRRGDLNGAEELLAETTEARPLATVLRARLALQRGDDEVASEAYHEALATGPDHDGLRLEHAEALALLGLWGEAEIAYRLAGEAGSREAETHYTLARFGVLNQKMDEAEAHFRDAWELLPVARPALFDDPILATISARPDLFPVFDFSSPAEPRVEYRGPRQSPVALPAGFEVVVSGGFLRATTPGGGAILVPGGAALAPAETPIADAGAEARREAEAALARVPALLEAVRAGESPSPFDRGLESAASALAEAGRWAEALELTAGIEGAVDRARPGLVKIRAQALLEGGRTAEARGLLVSLAESDRANRRKDPGTFFQLAELFAASGDYDLAVRSLRKGNSLTPGLANFARIRQIEMEQRLAADSKSYRTRHFDIRYPRLTGEQYASDLGSVLEAEWTRLQRWIPVRASERVDVDLYPVIEFLEAYSTVSLVVGLYDGRLRVPFADLHSLHPELVSILSHELAHAMISVRTSDQAPKWFQEGLAQHVQMVQEVLNPIPDLHAASRVLSLPVVETILAGFSEPRFIELAYGESAWAVHFIEARYGVAGIHRMLDAFAAGLPTGAAVQRALGLSTGEFDRAAWRWCREEAPSLWPAEVRRYDREMDGLIRTARKERPDGDAGAAPARRPAAAGFSLSTAMPRWHRGYAAKVSPVKGALGPVARMAKGRQAWDDGTACRQLGQRLSVLLSSDALAAPDPAVAAPLVAAFRSLDTMVGACLNGQRQEIATHLADAERSLGKAAQALGRYRLAP